MMEQQVKSRPYKKKKSGLSSWKKKLNLKKRFATKLPVHGRHIRGLMSSWQSSDIQSVLDQYEMSGILKELSKMADMSRQPAPTLSQDLSALFQSQSHLTDTVIQCKHTEFFVHKAILLCRSTYFKDLIIAQSAVTSGVSQSANGINNTGISRLTVIRVDNVSVEDLRKVLEVIYSGNEEDRYASLRVKNQNILQTSIENIKKGPFKPYNKSSISADVTVRLRSSQRVRNKQRFSMDERILSNLSYQKKFDLQNCISSSTKRDSSSDNMLKTISLNLKYVPNRLKYDTSILLEQAEYNGDVKLIFVPTRNNINNTNKWNPQQYSVENCHGNLYQAWLSKGIVSNYFSYKDRYEPVLCHKAIIGSRSPFLRRLIDKQEKGRCTSKDTVLMIEIDSGVIPPRYINVVLHAMYTDKIDITRTARGNREGILPQGAGSSILQMRDAIELHHVANFLEFPALAHGCEDLIVRSLEPSNLLQVLHWTTLPHGSQWVKRQLFSYMREKFAELTSTSVLYELSETDIIEVLQSDFVNASELDILKSVLRWGEYELLRRLEKREPQLMIPQSISRHKTASVRRRELVALRREELHECTAPVLKCVRTQHLLPYNPDVLVNAIKRGVISRPPAHLLETFNEQDGNCRAWIREKAGPCYIPPRLFMPYVEECRNILNERLAQESSGVSLRSIQRIANESTTPAMPDNLFMVSQPHDRSSHYRNFQRQKSKKMFPTTKYIDGVYHVPEPAQWIKMKQREVVIQSLPFIKKLFSKQQMCSHPEHHHSDGDLNLSDYNDDDNLVNCNRCIGRRLIHKIILRENNLPDHAFDLLERTEKFYSQQEIKSIKLKSPMSGKPPKLTALNGETKLPSIIAVSEDICEELSTEIKELNIAMKQIEEICNDSPILYRRSPRQERNVRYSAHTDGEIDNSSSDEDFNENYKVSYDLEKFHPVAPIVPTRKPKKCKKKKPHQQRAINVSSDDEQPSSNVLDYRDRFGVHRSSTSTNASFQSIPDVAAPATSSWKRHNNDFYQDIALQLSSSSGQESSSDENEFQSSYIRPLNDNILMSRNHPPSFNLTLEYHPHSAVSCLRENSSPDLCGTAASRQSIDECGKYFFSSQTISNMNLLSSTSTSEASSSQHITTVQHVEGLMSTCPWVPRSEQNTKITIPRKSSTESFTTHSDGQKKNVHESAF